MGNLQVDIASMKAAVMALSRIPTAHRRSCALRWLVARVQADIDQLVRDEHIEHVADGVAVVLGEPHGR